MSSTYRLKATELDERFLQSLKDLYGNKEVEIAITEVNEDETAYLLHNEANKRHLLGALENIENGRNLVTLKAEDLQ